MQSAERSEKLLVRELKNLLTRLEDDAGVSVEAPVAEKKRMVDSNGCARYMAVMATSGDVTYAGSDSSIYVTVGGGEETLMDTSGHDDHEEGSVDIYDLGEICHADPSSLTIRLDGSDGWHAASATIIEYGCTGSERYFFPLNRWFDSGADSTGTFTAE